jgi:aryl-alcohol dehydrogenase-like predicted oxidoreductase
MVDQLKTVDLGSSGLKVSELGCGGIPIMRVGLEEAKLIIKNCFQLGIRFFDTAHVYNDSEEKMGLALEPVRDEVVLATKVWAKDAAGAAIELAMSFERLRTKRIDLIQCHNVSNQPDLDRVMGQGGAYEALAQGGEQGRGDRVVFPQS